MSFGFIFILIIFAFLTYIISMSMDNSRIAREIESKGGTLLSKRWAPFGKGWFGEKNDRIYKVVYEDRAGNIHEAYVKTSMWSGVYFTEDKIIEYAEGEYEDSFGNEAEELRWENEQLKKEIERLKRNRG